MSRTFKLGIVIPDANTTMEPELPVWIPTKLELRTVRVKRPGGMLRREDLPAELERVAQAGADLAGFGPDLVVMGCTAAGFLAGPDGDAQFCERLSHTSGAPVVSAAGSMVKILREKKVSRVALVSPYGPLVNNALREFLARTGFTITRFEGFEVAGIKELLALRAQDVADRARRAVTDDSQALFVACSQLPTYGALEQLERETQRPAWSSVRAVAWNACQTLGASFGDTQ